MLIVGRQQEHSKTNLEYVQSGKMSYLFMEFSGTEVGVKSCSYPPDRVHDIFLYYFTKAMLFFLCLSMMRLANVTNHTNH